MFVDQRGLPLTTASDQAVIAFDSTIDSYLALRCDTGLLLKSALQADPDMVMAHCLKGYFFKLMAAGPLEARAAETQAKAETLATESTVREQAHVAALGHWCN
ncbi:MAG: tetratricopeptide repeat protein, partial [Pseudomonadota bacterium]|nr:tetratricopeptide repeat protein [Pseudomonadota bacterium]